MTKLTVLNTTVGVGIAPLSPSFYHKPQSIDDLLAIMTGRILDNLGVENQCFSKWSGL